jgi:hypothetical protein
MNGMGFFLVCQAFPAQRARQQAAAGPPSSRALTRERTHGGPVHAIPPAASTCQREFHDRISQFWIWI